MKIKNLLKSLIILISVISMALASTLEPFKMDLEGEYYMGTRPFNVTIKVDGYQELKKINNTTWEMRLSASGRLASIEEVSIFKFENETIIPISYERNLKVAWIEENQEIEFGKDKIIFKENGKVTSKTSNQQNIFDPLNYTLYAMQKFKEGKTKLDFKVADNKRTRGYRLENSKNIMNNSSYKTIERTRRSRYDTYIIVNKELNMPIQIMEWKEGNMEFQIRTKSVELNNQRFNQFSYFSPNKKRPPN